jgi:hypothetical protein
VVDADAVPLGDPPGDGVREDARSPAGTAPAVVLSSEAGVLHASSRRGDADCAEEDDRVPDVACGRYALIGLFAPPTCDQFVTAQV